MLVFLRFKTFVPICVHITDPLNIIESKLSVEHDQMFSLVIGLKQSMHLQYCSLQRLGLTSKAVHVIALLDYSLNISIQKTAHFSTAHFPDSTVLCSAPTFLVR